MGWGLDGKDDYPLGGECSRSTSGCGDLDIDVTRVGWNW